MKKLKILILFFLLMTLAGMLGRTAFYVVYYDLIASNGETGLFPMLWHGLQLDVAIAGYASLLPAFVIIVAQWWNGKTLLWIWRVYQAIIVTALVVAFVANIALYKYWGFPLDSTPLFFLENSPQEFIACLTIWQMIFGPIAIILLIVAVYLAFDRLTKPERTLGTGDGVTGIKSAGWTLACILFIGILVIFIRGGFTVSVNNVGKVYFSSNIRLNHAAVNPVFSFVDSATDEDDFATKYRFMDDKEATSLFSKMVYTEQRDLAFNDSILTPTFQMAIENGRTGKGDGARVIFVIMESFSKYIMADGGHVKNVTPNLDRLAREGVYFNNFYANSFRTDRGVMAILSGYPAQPTMSLMKFPHKTNNLYSIARSLKKDGYDTQFVYGGDADFTNCRSYLKGTGVDKVVSEEDYAESVPRGKWGVDDGELFERALQEMKDDNRKHNVFRIIQTSSSHEPYEVPYKKLNEPALNAFSYTDDCIGKFIATMKKRPDWDKTLIVFVADHLGCYPEDLDGFKIYRYQIPLIFAGGAIKEHRIVSTLGTQQDIAATLLPLLGLSHREFKFSKDIFDPRAPHFAFFDIPDAMGMVTEDNKIIYDNASNKVVLDEGTNKGKNLRPVKAYLQKLYDDIANL